jgi:hypothetical protein
LIRGSLEYRPGAMQAGQARMTVCAIDARPTTPAEACADGWGMTPPV